MPSTQQPTFGHGPQVVDTLCERERVDKLAEQFMAALLMNYSSPLNFDSLASLAYEAAEAMNKKRNGRVN